MHFQGNLRLKQKSFENGSTLKGRNLLPIGVNCFVLG